MILDLKVSLEKLNEIYKADINEFDFNFAASLAGSQRGLNKQGCHAFSTLSLSSKNRPASAPILNRTVFFLER